MDSAGSQNDRTVVGLIFIDNYDEVMESMEELRFPLLIANIDRNLNALSQQLEGIVKKIDNDKYILLFALNKLDVLKENKFAILEQVRAIDMGNKVPVTLSIGISLDGGTLSERMSNARAAVDLALGRGGDQVLVKNADKYLFYGGSAGEGTRNHHVRARVKAYALKELIEESENIIIMGHHTPDMDSFSAAIGVYKIANALQKPCSIVLNDIPTSLKLLHDRLMTLKEYREGVFVNSEQALAQTSEKTLLIVVDTHRPSILECVELLTKATKTVVFDHHRKAPEFITGTVLTYHEPFASSTAELVTGMLQYMPQVKLRDVEADALLAGIVVDTKNFTVKTGAKTFDAAAYLRRNSADMGRVRLLFQYDFAAYKAKTLVVNSAEIFNGNMAIGVCSSDAENPQLTIAQAADELLNISGIKASFVLCEGDNGVLISARSLSGINVQVIMERLNGGGHQTVAGAQLPGTTLEDAKRQLKEAIKADVEGTK